MRDLISGLISTLCGLVGIHFSYEQLLTLRDKEVGPIQRWCMNNHLHRCPICLRHAALIEEDIKTFTKINRPPLPINLFNLSRSLRKLRHEINNWEATNRVKGHAPATEPAASQPIIQQVEKELGFYLGNRAAAAFLLKMGNEGAARREVLGEAESVLRDFLGPSAATAITRKILFAQMLNQHSVQGSHPA